MASIRNEVDGKRLGHSYQSIPTDDGDQVQEEVNSRRTDNEHRVITVTSVCVFKLISCVLFVVLACVVTGIVVTRDGKNIDNKITGAAEERLLEEIAKVEIDLKSIINKVEKNFTSVTDKDRERFQMEFMALNQTIDKSIKLVQEKVEKVIKGLNKAFEEIENIERFLNVTTHRYSTLTIPISTVTMTTTPINESRCITHTTCLMHVLVLVSIWNVRR